VDENPSQTMSVETNFFNMSVLFLFFESWQRNIRMVSQSISESQLLSGLVFIHLLAMTATL
jgi:hypothetical protein